MFRFVADHQLPTDRLKADMVTYNTAVGLWGINITRERGLKRAIPTQPIEDGKWTTLMVHRPGPAGPLHEQDEFRIFAMIDPLQYPLDQSVQYDNGGSFVVSR